VSPTSAFSDLRLTKHLKAMFDSRYPEAIPTWPLKRDWIVILLVRRERFVTIFRPDLLGDDYFGSVSKAFLQDLTWSFG
jgi:hypothetical protein